VWGRGGGKLSPSFGVDFEFLLDGRAAASMLCADEIVSLRIPAPAVVGVDDRIVDAPTEACCRWARPPELARSSAAGGAGEEVRTGRRGWSVPLMRTGRLAPPPPPSPTAVAPASTRARG
jgi:hypothetical protein